MGNANESPFPLVCSCGAVHDAASWLKLPLVGVQPDGEGGFLELRNCDHCHSTRAIEAVEPVTEPSIGECLDCLAIEQLTNDRCGFCHAMSSGSMPVARVSEAA